MTAPLAGFVVTACGRSTASRPALEVLTGLGAVPDGPADRPGPTGAVRIEHAGSGRQGRARLTELPHALVGVAASGVPAGVVELALGRGLAAGALAAWVGSRPVEVDSLAVVLQLHLPAVMAAAYGSRWWPRPPRPRPAPGGGWLNVEVGAPGDADAFDRLMGAAVGADAGALATEAQAWRLAVCEYRAGRRPPPWRSGRRAPPSRAEHHRSSSPVEARSVPSRDGHRAAVDESPLAGLRVCDLTAMWAGPLATWLLAQLGADVVKVEPTFRPDGTRAVTGPGVWPGGRRRGPAGCDSALFNALGSNKRTVAIDAPPDGADLLRVATSADLLIDSFSPRVMPQLGLDDSALGQQAPSLISLSIPAFPEGPLRPWVAYGTGVHALSGLGWSGTEAEEEPFAAPGVSYPDPLAGLEAAVTALAGVAARRAGWAPSHLEVSLATTVEPLLEGVGRAMPEPRPDAGSVLLRAAVVSGAAQTVVDAAGVHFYPAPPFRGVGLGAGTEAAPRWPPPPLPGGPGGMELPWRR